MTLCVCGAEIVWRPYPPIPFPDVATVEQLRRQERGGRWVHPYHHGDYNEWCVPRTARPIGERKTMDDVMLVGGGRLRWWGSDCILEGGCEGNTTPDSMQCDNCGSDEFTVPLYEG